VELGSFQEANEELDKITPNLRVHPDVLELRWQIFANAKKWDACFDIATAIIEKTPHRVFGWIHRSFALHELKQTEEARDSLLRQVLEPSPLPSAPPMP